MSQQAETIFEFRRSELAELERFIEKELSLLAHGSVTVFPSSDAGHDSLPSGALVVWVEVSAQLRGVVNPDAVMAAISDVFERRAGSAPEAVVLSEPEPAESRGSYAERWREGYRLGFAAYHQGRRLMGPSDTSDASASSHATTETERELAKIWGRVLQLEVVPRHATFFALGGNSLRAVQMAAGVREQLGVTLGAPQLYESPTLALLGRAIDAQRGQPPEPGIDALARAARGQRPALAPTQRRMLLAWQLDPHGSAYNICGALRICGALDVAALDRALTLVVARHEALRTRFPEFEGEAYQHVDPARPVASSIDDLDATPPGAREERLRELLQVEAQAPFDLEHGPLFRARLIRLDAERHVLAVTLHHAVADGASMNVLLADLAELYAVVRRGDEPRLEPALQFADYAAWQTRRLLGGESQRQLDYWREQLPARPALLPLPSDRPRPMQQSFRGESHRFELDPALVARAREFARRHDASLFMVLHAAYVVLLAEHSGEQDLCVGTAVANRVHPLAQRMVGACVNTLVLRSQVRARDSFVELLARVKQAVSGAQLHQELPFDRLVEALEPERSAGHHPLFQVMHNHQQRELSALRGWPGLDLELVAIDLPVARFDLSLNTEESEDGRLSALLVYASDLFDQRRIARLAEHYRCLLEALVERPESPLRALAWLSPSERAQIQAWNEAPDPSALDAGRDELLPFVLASTARRRPDACALVFGAESLTYAELTRRVERLARELAASGAGPDVVVGVLVPRSIGQIVSVLAVLACGAAYLPLDPDSPRARLAFLIDDARARIVITRGSFELDASVAGPLTFVDLESVSDDAPPDAAPGAMDDLPGARLLHPDHLAYVLYTSGSTGRPKAVGNTHGALRERLAWMQREYRLGPEETLLHKTPDTFDVSVWEVLWPLSVGARLVIAAPGDHRDPRELARLTRRHGVSTLHFVPSMLREVLALPELSECVSLRRLFSGGEALDPDLVRRVFERLPSVRLDNRYGPTEALINVSCWSCAPDDRGPVPIGRPLSGNVLRILDASLRPVPIGVAGELYIGGVALARGYVGAPALTAERFVPDPFSAASGRRMYRSGDWARFRADGAIEYLGRKDEQVKIRGVRVELGEVEATLRELSGVRAAAVVARPGPGGLDHLVAYVVADPSLGEGDLSRSLEQRLPAALIPSHVVRCAELPLLVNGKVDRKALPAPRFEERAHTAPHGELEQRLAALWADVLKVPAVGRGDDFFALGGHSLLATRLVARVRQAFEVDLPLRELFEASGFEAFARRVQAVLEAPGRTRLLPIGRVARGKPLPLSASQERMWFAWSLEPHSAAYNVAGAVELRGALDVPALRRALSALLERHEALRTTFSERDAMPLSHIAERVDVPFQIVDLSAHPEPARDAEASRHAREDAHRPFDLRVGPLLRVTLLVLAPLRHRLLVTLHHIVAEGWAMDVFAREWTSLYDAFRRGLSSPLPALPLQYADYAAWQRQWLASEEAALELAFWKRTLAGEHPVLELPSDRPRPAVQSFRGDYHRFALGAELARRVREACARHGVTLSMAIQASFAAFLYRYTGQTDLRIGVPIAGRTRPELEGLIGAFLNVQVLRCSVTSAQRSSELFAHVKSVSLDAQSHQGLPFHHVVEAVHPERSAAHLPLFQVMCNVQRWGFQQTHEAAGLEFEFLPNDARAAKCDLALDVSEVQDRLECAFVYSMDLFDAPTVERMARHWVALLDDLVGRPAARVGELCLLPESERSRLLDLWNASHSLYRPDPRSVPELLLERLARAPDRVAVVCEAGRLSAGGLLDRSGRLASRLQRRGVGPEIRVAVCLERSVDVLVAFLAVWRAGGAFIPLDTRLPTARLTEMARQAGARVLLTHAAVALAGEVAPEIERVRLDDPLHSESAEPAPVVLHDEHLAYILYTSGSTGRPKGVAVPHGAFSMHCQAVGSIYRLESSDTALSLAALGFDAFLEQTFVPLLAGARVVLDGPSHEDTPALCELVAGERVTLIYPPTSRIAELAAHAQNTRRRLWVRRCCVGGEAVSSSDLDRIREGLGCAVTNGYGPTETVVTPLLWRTDDGSPVRGGVVPIGRAVGHRSIYVLDERLELAAPLVTGELYIGAGGLARGYDGLAGATAERFVPDPFGGVPGGRLYRTGDLVRDRGDGIIEFVGRRDGQIKLRGHRIELGEIEGRLARHPAIDAAAVVVRSDASGALGRPRLVAYVAAKAAPDGLAAELEAELSEQLPDYMVPSRFVILPALPRTPNGKVDQRALPAPEARATEHRAPQGEDEARLAEIWLQLLPAPRIGRDDNFFDLGGDSIVALQLVSRARERGLFLTARDVFQHQTLRALAQAARPSSLAEPEAEPLQADVPLTPIQARFFETAPPRPSHYNQALLLDVRGSLQPDRLRLALGVLCRHHDALRLRFRVDGHGAWSQRYAAPDAIAAQSERADDDGLLWSRVAEADDELRLVTGEAQRSLNLDAGPLLRVVLVQRGGGREQLLVVVHHLVVDGVSWRLLLEDLQTAYLQLALGQAPSLPPRSSSYRSWAETLAAYAHGPELERELDRWVSLASNAGAAAALPCLESPESSTPVGETAVAPAAGSHSPRVKDRALYSSRSSERLTLALLRELPVAYRTRVADLLLAALARTLCRWTGQASIGLELEAHGRDERFEGVKPSRTVGWFTSVFPVCLTIVPGEGDAALAGTIQTVKEQLAALPGQGLGYGVLRYLGSDEVRARLARPARPRVCFNYLGQLDAGTSATDLWQLSAEAPVDNRDGETPLEHWLSIDARVERGQLTLSWAYAAPLFPSGSIERLAADYERELELLVAHARAKRPARATPADFPLAELDQVQVDALTRPVPTLDGELAKVVDIYPATALQQGLLFHGSYEAGGSDAYVSQLSADLAGLDPGRFARAWQSAVDRHTILRTAFVPLDAPGAWVQVVREHARLDLRQLDAPGASEAELAQLADEERSRGFDVSRAPLQRLLLVQTGEARHRFIWTHHHVLMDGWSLGQLIGEVLREYAGETSAAPAADFRDYVAWLARRDVAAEERFWRGELAALDEPTCLASALARAPSGQGSAGPVWARYVSSLAVAPSTELARFARARRLTLNTLVQAAWLLLLQRHTRQETVVCGATVAGRPADLPGAETALGLFINTVPVIARPRPDLAVGAWLSELQRQQLLRQDHEHAPLSAVQRWADRAGQALFDTLLVFENYPLDAELRRRGGYGLEVSGVRTQDQSHYALTLEVTRHDELAFTFKYDAQRFSESQIAALGAQLQHTLLEMARKPESALGSFGWTLDVGAPSARPRSDDLPRLHHALGLRASAQPDAVALVQGAASLSFGELDRRSNRLAGELRARGVGCDVLVGVCAPRSLELVIGLLAIVKAGGAYVPLDPAYPDERLGYVLADSGVRLVLTERRFAARLTALGATPWCLDDTTPEAVGAMEAMESVTDATRPEHLVYCIYTSGSTGRPKGAAITHGGLSNYLQQAAEMYRLPELDGSVLHSSIGFDLSVTSLWAPLWAGKRVELAADGNDLDALVGAVIRSRGVDLLKLTPSHGRALAEVLPRPFAAIRALVVGGEALDSASVAALRRWAPSARILNEYGPTEAVVGCSVYEVEAGAGVDAMASLPIGLAIPGAELFVVDAAFQQVPPGVAGELCIGGVGLARGYHRRPGLTAERFVPHPFAGAVGERLYRSGDLARQRDDGSFEYLGRLDHQVKLRGHRIELGEIEARLREHAAVKDVAVVLHETPSARQLVGYVVLEASASEWPSLSRANDAAGSVDLESLLLGHLAAGLPSFMLPAQLVFLAALPLTSNGKLDRKALPEPGWTGRAEYVEPQTEVERQLAAIWCDVLRVPRVGRNDNFFDLGGDSIGSLQVVTRARRLGFGLRPRDVFERQTIAALADVGAGRRAAEPDGAPAPTSSLPEERWGELGLPLGDVENAHPVSPVQRGVLFHALHDPEPGVYVSQLRTRAYGLDVPRFEQAWRQAIQVREILRTAFWADDEQGVIHQVVLRTAPVPIKELDYRGRELTLGHLNLLAEQERLAGFDLKRPPLQKVLLVQVGDAEHHVIWTHHHALVDGWSNARLLEDVLGHYETGAVPYRAGRYSDYLRWLERREPAKSERYWKERMAELEEPTLLGAAFAAPHRQRPGERGHALLSSELGEEHTALLARFARQQRITLNTIVQAAWLLLLQHYTGQRSVAFGATVSGRPPGLADVESMLGLFINTLPVVERLSPERRVGDWLRELQRQNLELREHEHVPLADVQRWSNRRGQELFDTIVVFENYPMSRVLAGRGTLRFDAALVTNPTNYALAIQVFPEQRLRLSYGYWRERFAEGDIRTIARRFEHLLLELAQAPERALGALTPLPVWDAPELATTSAPIEPRPALPCAHESFERVAAITPDATAVVCGDGALSYGVLEAQAARLARRLRASGLAPGAVVGLYVARSSAMAIGAMAILKAGSAYLPLDVDQPRERLCQSVRDSGMARLLCGPEQARDLPPLGIPSSVIDERELLTSSDDGSDADGPDAGAMVQPLQVAYCIYTSGSTGKPKAAENTHAALSNRLDWMQREYRLTSADRVLQKAPFGFDIAVAELIWPLASGAQVIMAPPGAQRDPAELARVIQRHGVSVLDFVSSLLGAFVESGYLRQCPTLRLCTTGAEALPSEVARRFVAQHPARLVNEYGPTEAAIATTYWDCSVDESAAVVPIGKPIANTSAYVLDGSLNLGAPFARGELYIAGPALAQGYRQRPALTAERFVPNPFSAQPGERMYRTGDSARWRGDGVLEYLGRVDEQVKIRGYRIELGEIESTLRAHPEVSDAAVVAREAGSGKRLVGYVVPRGGGSLEPRALRDHLGVLLPDYMVPAQIVVLEKLPLTRNGKLDRKALPEPEWQSEEAFLPPRTLVERQLAQIWREALGAAQVGRADNFFELGGDSIVTLQVVRRARELELDIAPRDVFLHQTLEALAQAVEQRSARSLDPGAELGTVPLSPAQARWLEAAGAGRESSADWVALRAAEPLRVDVLRSALEYLVEHHAALRSCCERAEDGSFRQGQAPMATLRACWQARPLLTVDSSGADADLRRARSRARQALDPSHGVVLHAVLLDAAEPTLVLAAHPLVVDERSWAILLMDLQTVYRQLSEGHPASLPPKTLSFKAWTEKLRELAQSGALESELPFWSRQLSAEASAELPLGEGPPRTAVFGVRLSTPKTVALFETALGAYRVRPFDLLLTALTRALCELEGTSSATLQLACEERRLPTDAQDPQRTIGRLSSSYPLRVSVERGRTRAALKGSIEAVKEQLRAVPRGGLAYSALEQLAVEARTALRALPQPRVSFSFGSNAVDLSAASPRLTLLAGSLGSGPALRLHPGSCLAFGAWLDGGRLRLRCRYRADVLPPDTARLLLRSFRLELESLIEHCLTDAVSSMTPSDVVGASLSRDDLDAVLNTLTEN